MHEAATSRPNRQAVSPINPLFTWLFYTLSISSRPHIQNGGVPFKPVGVDGGKIKAMQSRVLHRKYAIWRTGNGNPTRGENEVGVGSARLSLRAVNWRNLGDGISREHRVLVSFGRNKGSSFLQPGLSLCINSEP